MKVKEMQNICQKLRPGLDRQKSLIEHFRHICFTGKNIITFNERICVAFPFETDFECFVMGYDFIDIISNLPQNEDVHLRMVKDKLRIRGSGTSVKMSTFNKEHLTDSYKNIFTTELDWKPLPLDFMDAVNLCHFSVAKDLTRQYLNYIRISGDDVISSDNLRISNYKMGESIDAKIFIPGAVCKSLLQYSATSFAVFSPWLGFKTDDGIQFFCRTADVEYPDVSHLFEFEGQTFQLPVGLKQVVESLKVVTEEEFLIDRHMTVTIKDKKVSCFVEKATVSANKWIETDITEELVFIINPVFFNEVLEKTRTIKIAEGRAMFVSGNFKHLLSLPIKQAAATVGG